MGGKPLRRYSHPSLVKMCHLRQVLQQQPIYLVDLCIKIVTTAKSNTFQSKRNPLLSLLFFQKRQPFISKPKETVLRVHLLQRTFRQGPQDLLPAVLWKRLRK